MSGKLKLFSSGAVRSADCESVRYDLIHPVLMERLAAVCAEGAVKYGDYNWELGMDAMTLLNHALRHQYRFLGGDREEDHLGHALWGVGGAIVSVELWPEQNRNLRTYWCRPPEQQEKPGVTDVLEYPSP